jgi:5-methyltetrahydropteroyltriglutamate--homocysteine methyltransferase
MSQILFPTSVVGSMPRSQFVLDLINDRPPLPPDRCEHEMDTAIRYIVALQEHAGLDVLTDGEWRRKSYIGVIAELAHGFELGATPDGRPYTVVVDKLSPKTPGFIAKEITFVRSLTARKVKATLPSPALLGERMWHPEKSAKAYPKRDDFVRDCVPVLRRELELLQQAGADIVQIDDPHLCLFVDPQVRGQYSNADAAADFSVDMVNALVEGITKPLTRPSATLSPSDGERAGVRAHRTRRNSLPPSDGERDRVRGDRAFKLAVHLCRRAGARVRGEAQFQGGYDPILSQLNRLKVHHLTMEFTAPGAGDMAVFKKLREDFEIGLGCVSVQPGVIDSPETIASRVRQAVKFLAKERITLNPDCGFAPGSGAVVSMDEAYQKICNEVAAARLLREEFGG